MIAAPELKPVHRARRTAHAPRPLPVWLQVGVVLLLLWNGLQAIVHYNEPSLAANTDQAAPSAPQSRFEYFYQPDRLHSAPPQERTAYDPYGAVRAISSGSQLATFQYTGDYYHATSGLNLTHYRALDPNTGRWLSRDPLENAERLQGPDLYEYAKNDPVLYTDPDGRVVPVVIAGIVVVGGGLGHLADIVKACTLLHPNEQMFIRTPLTIMASALSGFGAANAQCACGGRPAIYMVRVWQDAQGNCHSEWVIICLTGSPGGMT